MPRSTVGVHDRLTEAPGIDLSLARQVLATPATETIKENRRGRVDRVEIDGEFFARKHYPLRGARRWLPFLSPSSRARRSWQAARAGSKLGLPLPEPICLFEGRKETVLVSRWFDGEQFHIWHARRIQQGDIEFNSEVELFRWLGRSIAEVFTGGFRCSDMAPQNLVLAGHPEGPWSFALVDLDDATVDRCPSPQEIEVSLAQLAHLPPTVSSTCLKRALDSFLAAGGSQLLALPEGKAALRNLEQRIANEVSRLQQAKESRMHAKEQEPHRFSGWGLDRSGFPI
ncbi:MAG TPA: hypothetical protein EYN79_03790 [Planctomycetes bacterium]|nr:hypothetical protein [Planctomycetota bacterium]